MQGWHRSASIMLIHLILVKDETAIQKLLKVSDPYEYYGKYLTQDEIDKNFGIKN
jgi:hypothetical protein